MNKFYKVSYEEYFNDVGSDEDLQQEYEDIQLPRRATKYSAGYDFFAPFSFSLEPNETIIIPTGIRCQLDYDRFLAIYPRSSLGFKSQVGLCNTVGIVDADYYHSDNEGHIFIKLVNRGDRTVYIKKGEAFAQGIIQYYDKTVDDDVGLTRNGGFGSTNK